MSALRQEVLQVLLQQFLNGTEGISAGFDFGFASTEESQVPPQMSFTVSDPLTGVPLRSVSADRSVLRFSPSGSVQCVVL